MKAKTQAALCAAAIRSELKAKFPQTKFKVTSSNYSMGDSVNVFWTNGAPLDGVEQLLKKYQYGKFNSMEDIYEETNAREDIPQTKFLFCERKISDEIYLAKFEEMKERFPILKDVTDIRATDQKIMDFCGLWTVQQFIYQKNGGFAKIDFSPKEEPKEEPKIIGESLKIENLELVNYSDKAVALFGDTKPIKDKLKALGGRFNPFLMNGGEKMAGWIFAKTKQAELCQLLNLGAGTQE